MSHGVEWFEIILQNNCQYINNILCDKVKSSLILYCKTIANILITSYAIRCKVV